MLFVSHDRYFINKIADSLLIFEKDKITYFKGTYESYLERKKLKLEEPNVKIEKDKKASIIKTKPKNNNNSLIKKIEREIDQKEKKKKEIETQMLDENIYNDYKKMNELQKELNNLDKELEEKMLKWEYLSS